MGHRLPHTYSEVRHAPVGSMGSQRKHSRSKFYITALISELGGILMSACSMTATTAP